MFDRLFRELADMLDKEERGREKRDTIKLMLECIDKFTVFLEDFGVKEKAVQTINIGVEKQLVLIKDSKVIDAEIVKKVEEHIVEGELVGEEDEQRNA
jgi:transcriptional regulator of heat shock response